MTKAVVNVLTPTRVFIDQTYNVVSDSTLTLYRNSNISFETLTEIEFVSQSSNKSLRKRVTSNCLEAIKKAILSCSYNQAFLSIVDDKVSFRLVFNSSDKAAIDTFWYFVQNVIAETLEEII